MRSAKFRNRRAAVAEAVCDSVLEVLEERQFLSVAPPPNGPYGLSATATSATSVQVRFIDNADNETGFVVQRTQAGSGAAPVTFQVAASAGVGGAVTFNDTSASPSTTYSYTAYATNGLPSSVAGPGVVMTPPEGSGSGGDGTVNPGGPPNGPYGLSAIPTGAMSVTL